MIQLWIGFWEVDQVMIRQGFRSGPVLVPAQDSAVVVCSSATASSCSLLPQVSLGSWEPLYRGINYRVYLSETKLNGFTSTYFTYFCLVLFCWVFFHLLRKAPKRPQKWAGPLPRCFQTSPSGRSSWKPKLRRSSRRPWCTSGTC